GKYLEFDSTGTKIVEGNFNKNLKHGKWVDFRAGDTIHYKLGAPVIPKTDQTAASENKPSFIKRFFSKNKDSISDTNTKKTTKTKKIDSSEKENKSFFKRLFGSKEDSLPAANETLMKPKKAKTKKKEAPKGEKQSFFKKLFGSKKDENQKTKK